MEEGITEQGDLNEYVIVNYNISSKHDKILRFDKTG